MHDEAVTAPYDPTSLATNLCAGNKGCSDEDSDLGESEVPVPAEVEQGMHEVHLFGEGGRANKSKGAPVYPVRVSRLSQAQQSHEAHHKVRKRSAGDALHRFSMEEILEDALLSGAQGAGMSVQSIAEDYLTSYGTNREVKTWL